MASGKPGAVQILAATGIITVGDKRLTDDRMVFNALDAEPILLKAKHAISERDAQSYLNAGRVHTKLLANANLITPFTSTGQHAHKAYDRRDLDEFLSTLSARASVIPDYSDPIYRIPEAAKRANCSAMEIVRAILDGSLKWVGQIAEETGYMAILVDVAEVRQLVRGEHGDLLTLTVVQRSLKTTFGVVEALIRLRILPSQTATSPINRCPYTAVKAEDLKAFQAEFGSLHELALEHGIHFLRLKTALTEHGIEPAFAKPAVPATFYRRADVPKNF